VTRSLTVAVLGAFLVACQGSTPAAATPSPIPSPRTTVTAAVLQQSETPKGLGACAGSGPIAGYLTRLRAADSALGLVMTLRWQQLQAKGADDAAISVYGDGGAACTSELGVTTTFKAVASFVAIFKDEGQAERAWASGVLGFVPPAPDQVAPGLVRGTTTGLGVSSWTYDRPTVRIACWRRSVFVALVVLTNLEVADFKTVTTTIDARLN